MSTVLFTVLAYPDEAAAEAVWNVLVAEPRPLFADHPRAEERSLDQGDVNVSFNADTLTILAIRVETVVMELNIWADDEMSEEEERALIERWPALQLSKIDKLLG